MAGFSVTRRGIADATTHVPKSTVSSGSTSSPLLFADSYMPAYQSSVDCSTQFNAALTAAGNIGSSLGTRCPLYLSPGRQYTVTNLTVPSYVEIVGTGALINRTNINGSPTFSCSNSTDVCFNGVHFADGTGTEAAGALNHHIFGTQAQRVRVLGCYANNWGQSAVYLVDSQYLWTLGNEFLNCGMTATATNPINFVNGANGITLPLKHVWCGYNNVSGNTNQIDFVVSGTPNRTDPDCDAHVFHNTFINLPTGHGACMGIEQGSTGVPISGFEFTGNNCYQLNSFNGFGSRTYAIAFSTVVANPNSISGITVTGGKVVSVPASSTNRGIFIDASDVTVSGVDINAGEIDIVWQHSPGGGNLTKLSVAACPSHSGTGTQVQLGANTDGTTFNMQGNTPTTSGTVTVPATTVAVAAQPFNRHFYVTAGASTCTMAVQGGPSPVIPSGGFGSVYVPAGCTVTPTYASAPTWTVQATT